MKRKSMRVNKWTSLKLRSVCAQLEEEAVELCGKCPRIFSSLSGPALLCLLAATLYSSSFYLISLILKGRYVWS